MVYLIPILLAFYAFVKLQNIIPEYILHHNYADYLNTGLLNYISTFQETAGKLSVLSI